VVIDPGSHVYVWPWAYSNRDEPCRICGHGIDGHAPLLPPRDDDGTETRDDS
jgi:hypothetical protein